MKRSVIVIGLGAFGLAAARELASLGHEVLAIDRDEGPVNDVAPWVTHAVQLDASDPEALRSVGAAEFDHAIVAVGRETEASIFATMALRQLGVEHVVAKAVSELHGAILERVGATHVVYPEREMGERAAHAFALPGVLDYLDVGPGFGLVKLPAPVAWTGRSLRDVDPGRLGLTVIAFRRGSDVTVNPSRDLVLEAADELVIVGPDERLEAIPR